MRTAAVLGWSVFSFLAGAGLFGAGVAYAQDLSSQNYKVLAPVVTSGGGYASSGSYSVLGVISEFVHDTASSASFAFNPGFAAYPFVSTPIVSATGGDALVNLSWTAATGAASYSVGQSTSSGGPYAFTPAGNVLAYSVSGLNNGTTYYFAIRVLDAQNSTIATSSEVSATPAASPPQNGGGSGGGGGGFTTVIASAGATVNFSGRAYPNSTVVLLKDGEIALSAPAGEDARFQFSLAGLSAGSYIFSVYGISSEGDKSTLHSFPETLMPGATTDIVGIFISPTIDIDKSAVRKGDNITIFGKSVASSTVTISIHSNPEFFVTTASDKNGAYLYTLDTSPLDFGTHLAKSKAASANQISNFGASVAFAVGSETILKKVQQQGAEDLNNDDHINLIDFSIMVYWFHRLLSGIGLSADLNYDGKVDLTDFSILASHWTG